MRVRVLTAWVLLTGCSPPAWPGAGDHSGALLDRLVTLSDLAKDHGGHRAVGSPGYAATSAWAADALAALGMEVTLEEVPVPTWTAEGLSLRIVDGTRLDAHAAPLTWTPGGRVEAAVAPVDLQLPPPTEADATDSGCEREDFQDFPAGSIALIQRGTCSFAQKAALAEEAGAVAVLIFNEGQHDGQDTPDGALDRWDRPTIPVVAIPYDVGAMLTEGPEVELILTAEVQEHTTVNVLAEREGALDDWLVLGAHLDSVSDGPGINDNGSGVALVLEVASALSAASRTPRGLRIALWGAEEPGLLGSTWHVRALGEDERVELFAYLNFDMVASPNGARFISDGDGSTFGPHEQTAADPTSRRIELLYEQAFTFRGLPTHPTAADGRSDYAAFAAAGVPTGGLFSGARDTRPASWVEREGGTADAPFDPCYHRACDDLDNVDLDLLDQMTAATLEVAHTLLRADVER